MNIKELLVHKKDYEEMKEYFEDNIKAQEDFIKTANEYIKHYETHYMYNSIPEYRDKQINDWREMKNKGEEQLALFKYCLGILTIK